MQYFTIDKHIPEQRVVQIMCLDYAPNLDFDFFERSFLLILLLDGKLSFTINNAQFTAIAPCFICFNEKNQPKFLSRNKFKAKAIYFHPSFLNVNMSFSFIRQPHYNDIASIHDLFLLKPFMDDCYVFPIEDRFIEKTINNFEEMSFQLIHQPDWYWSCRARSAFIDMIMTLEKHYEMLRIGELSVVNGKNLLINCTFVKKALLYIEANYMNKIEFDNILANCETNHTTLTNNFKQATGKSVMEYLQYYRIEVAKKKLRFTEVPLKDIAKSCGFSTTEHFSRIFSKFTNTSPAAFRINSVDKRKSEIKIK